MDLGNKILQLGILPLLAQVFDKLYLYLFSINILIEIKQVNFKATADRILTLSELCELVAGRATLLIEIKSRFESLGIVPVGNTPEQAGKFLAEEITKWSKVITTAGVKPEQ